MGSGLIWAGLGKGIADAGATFGNAMMKSAEDEYKLQRELKLEELREQRKLEREERDKKARIDEADRASKMADEMGAARRATGLNGLIASSIRAGEEGDTAPSPEALRSLLKSDPALAKQYQDMGLIDPSMPLTRNQERMQRAEDEYAAGIKIGAHSSVLEALDKKRTRVLDEIKEENREERERRKAANDERKTDELGRKTDALIEYLGKKGDAAQTTAGAAVTRAGAAVTNANRPRQSAADTSDLRTLSDFTQRERTLRGQMRFAYGENRDKLQVELDDLLDKRRQFEARRSGGDAAPAPAPAPRPAASAPKTPASGVTRGGSRWTLTTP